MTTYSKDSDSGRKYTTELHLIYRIVDSKFESFGLFETRPAAEKEIALINRKGGGWQIADVPCLGWGIVGDLLVGRNSDTERPLKN